MNIQTFLLNYIVYKRLSKYIEKLQWAAWTNSSSDITVYVLYAVAANRTFDDNPLPRWGSNAYIEKS